MNPSDFFQKLQNQFANNLPFVAYRNPNESIIKTFLQHDDTVYETTDFSESGFIFSPFNIEETSVLIPVEASIILESKSDIIEASPMNSVASEVIQTPDITSAKQNHITLVKKGIEAIHKGTFEKVVLSRQESVTISKTNPIKIYKRLLETYPTAYVYVWFHPKVGLWLGATPETLLHIENNQFSTMALAGTQVYKNTADVVWEDKELEEQQIVTNFIVSNLEKQLDNLKVSEVETVRAANLLHLKTHISGRVNSDASNIKKIIEILHPTPAVCGMPKGVAKQFILENEQYKRDFYTGFLGELNIKKSISRNTNRRNVENNAYASIKTVSNLFVNLRCMQIQNKEALLYIGGGITKDSNPNMEWEETIAKSVTMKKVLQ
ncbi:MULTISPECIES: chorismate-binding protein [Bizionia]|uniref:Isochorismate synthase n=1 Tax=Bizionia algoritergicola TaxID=291187 RepID=A0A5D0QY97_9FLAO|nr:MULTISPECIES: chorismate-binding protein [Bizionia]OBX21735.1 isochorismate synthase [Bizionia sp. APA-3]TYB73458.1 isochorismate synthase [Bizionia algoritergicola]